MRILNLMKLFHPLLYLCLFFPLNCQSFIRVENYIKLLPPGTRVAMIAQETNSNRFLLNYQSNILSSPASTQKIITALAALLELGSDFHFITTFETTGKLQGKSLQGSLVIRFSGDPTLNRLQLKKMITQLVALGINKINGNIILDTSIFTSHDRAPGWSWNNLTQCYNAPSSAAVIDHNCFSVSINASGNIGTIAPIVSLQYTPISIISSAHIIAKYNKHCELDMVVSSNQQYHLTGCIVKQNKKRVLAFAIQDATDNFGKILKAALQESDIEFSGKIIQQSVPLDKTTQLVLHESKPLSELLTIMLKQSDNLIADNLFRTIGHHYYHVPATWRTGSEAVQEILMKAGINLGNSAIIDGSGLSKDNLISAKTMMECLRYIEKHDDKLHLIAMLPVAGVDGTLKSRNSLVKAELTNKISAKTGSIYGVYNLAGFITTSTGKHVAFVQFLSGYVPGKSDTVNIHSIHSPLSQFENQLYRNIYLDN